MFSNPPSFLQNLSDTKPKIISSNQALDNNHTAVDMKEEITFTSSSDDLKRGHNEHILKRIPAGAEATVVLVGAVDFLDQPTIAFVRLAEGVLIPSLTEVTIPVRFLFTLLGPRNSDLDYHEIGRSISTLMSNTPFHKVRLFHFDPRTSVRHVHFPSKGGLQSFGETGTPLRHQRVPGRLHSAATWGLGKTSSVAL